MLQDGAAAIRFRGVDWFSWITGGGNSAVILTTETGIAEVVVTAEKALVLTNEIEAARLREEEIPSGFEIVSSRWQSPERLDEIAREIAGPGPVFSDRPAPGERALPAEYRRMKRRMEPEEIDRYRLLGLNAAQAMTEALGQARPDWRECELAAEGARSLWRRGIHPTLVLVAGEQRAEKHRHPFPTAAPVGARAMMVFCGRREGLYANLTRFVSFRDPTPEERRRMRIVAEIESVALGSSRPGLTLEDCYHALHKTYVSLGLESEIDRQHFGGLTGYLSREAFARPSMAEDPVILEEGQALAWNPTLPGSKIEDTILIGSSGPEILTADPDWPTFQLDGRLRPEVWIKP